MYARMKARAAIRCQHAGDDHSLDQPWGDHTGLRIANGRSYHRLHHFDAGPASPDGCFGRSPDRRLAAPVASSTAKGT